MSRKSIVMLGTQFDTMGGISSVVNVYREHGLFERFPIRYLATHCDGNKWQKLFILLRAWAIYCWWLLLGKVQLVHAHTSSRASFWRKSLFLWPAIWVGRPVVLHLHGSEFAIFHDDECGPLRKAMIKALFNRCARVIVLSAAWQNWVQSICTNKQVIAIYNPVTLSATAPWDARVPGTILSLGRLGRRKGSYDLVSALATFSDASRQSQLRLGGDGELAKVIDHANRLGIADAVRLLGWVKGSEKQAELNTAMIFTLPSYNEGLPMSVLEAMANGLPIVSTPVGGIPEAITDGEEGYLVEPGNIAALADALRTLVNDAKLAKLMGSKARKKVETTFSAQAILPKLESVYESLGATRSAAN